MIHQRYRYAILALAGVLLTLGATAVFAQSQSDGTESVADAARRAREQKKNAPKPVRTVTNDNLPVAPADTSNTPAAAPAAAPQASEDADVSAKPETKTNADRSAADDKAKQKKATISATLDRLKKELLQSQGELDVMKRKSALDNESYYSKTDFASDKDGKARLDAEAQQITDKQQAIEDLKAKIADLQEQLGEPAPAPPAEKDNSANTPSPEPPPNSH